MPQFGKSLRDTLQDAGVLSSGNGTVYYDGEDGNRAVYDVTGPAEGVMIINGVHVARDNQLGYSPCLPTSEKYFEEHAVDTQHGWYRVP